MEKVARPISVDHELLACVDGGVTSTSAVHCDTLSYDRLNASEQAALRAVWDQTIVETIDQLDLAQTFAAARYRYAELDEQGNLRVVGPATT